jgi:hypothetical protein
MYGLI